MKLMLGRAIMLVILCSLIGCAAVSPRYEYVFVSEIGSGKCVLTNRLDVKDRWQIQGNYSTSTGSAERGIVSYCDVKVTKEEFEARYRWCFLTGFSFSDLDGKQPWTMCSFRQANDGNYYFETRGRGQHDGCYWHCLVAQ